MNVPWWPTSHHITTASQAHRRYTEGIGYDAFWNRVYFYLYLWIETSLRYIDILHVHHLWEKFSEVKWVTSKCYYPSVFLSVYKLALLLCENTKFCSGNETYSALASHVGHTVAKKFSNSSHVHCNIPLSTDAVSSSVLFNFLMLATRVGHTCAHGYPHGVWFPVIWLAKRCDHHSQFVGLRSAYYNMHKRWSSSLVVHCVAARTRRAAVLSTVGRECFLAYMISGCHCCFCIQRVPYQVIVQQAITHYL